MRISSVKQNSVSIDLDAQDNPVVSGQKLSIKFCSNRDGTYTALVPVKLPNSGENGDTRVFVTLLPLTVAGEATSNNKGNRRVMVKVSMPYQAIDPDSTANGTDASRIDTARSGGILSAHMVISVPKAAETDLKGIHGTTMQKAAQAQVSAVISLLSVLIGPAGYGAFSPRNTSNDWRKPFRQVVNIRGLPDGEQDFGKVGGGDSLAPIILGPNAYDPSVPGAPTYGAARPVVLSDSLTGFVGTIGLDLSSVDNCQDFSNPEDPLARGLLGLKPFCEDAEAVVPSWVIQSGE